MTPSPPSLLAGGRLTPAGTDFPCGRHQVFYYDVASGRTIRKFKGHDRCAPFRPLPQSLA